MMNAIVITRPGEPLVLQIQQRPVPAFNEDEVLISIKAAGVNRPDVAQRQGKYAPPPGAPQDIPGLEIAGIVEKCGANVIRWKPGDRVCALIAGGGYATYATANALHCLPLPKGLDFVEAASLPETVFTVWHNVFRLGKLKGGENLLVHGGSSGIGITAIQLGKASGANVFITAGNEAKCDACTKLGADISINYKNDDFEKVLASNGVDVVLDMVGGDYIEKNFRLLKPDGRMVFINTMKGSKGSFDAYDLMRRRLTVTGSTLRNRENSFKADLAAEVEKNVWPFIESGKFRPVIYKTFKLQNAAAAHELMESSEHIGKIVLVAEDEQ
jgi:NADPH2:quinone reductase